MGSQEEEAEALDMRKDIEQILWRRFCMQHNVNGSELELHYIYECLIIFVQYYFRSFI